MFKPLPLVATLAVLVSIAAPATAQIPPAHYVCYYFTTPLPLMNFTVTGPGQYTDAGGNKGSFSAANGAGQFVFTGGNFDGQTAVFRPGESADGGISGYRWPRDRDLSARQRLRTPCAWQGELRNALQLKVKARLKPSRE